ncbi:MAG: ROK family protein [bacterium]
MIAAAIDTGGTKIMGAAVNERGDILEKIHVDNVGRTGAFILDSYFRIIDTLEKKYAIDAIGVGAGGRIDPRTGEVLYAVDIYSGYIGTPIKSRLQEKYQKPTAVDNDCKMALIGENWMGAIRGFKSVFGIIIGTGVGGGLLLDGVSSSGQAGGFGEIGHAVLHPNGKQCLCGQHGCVEKYVSGTALWQRYNEMSGQEAIDSGYEFFSRARQGDPAALSVLREFIENLALCAVTCANLYDPQALLFGGGILDTSALWWDEFVKEYDRQSSPHLKKIKLVRSALGNDAPLLGAAALAFSQHQYGVSAERG